MTSNISYLSKYEEIDGGYVAFGGDPKGGKITSKGKVSTDDEVPTNMALMAFSDSEVKESPDAPLVNELVSDNKLEKKTIFPTVAKIEFVRPKQQENPVRKPVKLTAITIKGKGWYLGIIIQWAIHSLSCRRKELLLVDALGT
nr:hypothetical protein [Tanacetum cinerariifolium]